jgi:hypothetical protein
MKACRAAREGRKEFLFEKRTKTFRQLSDVGRRRAPVEPSVEPSKE